MDHNDPRLLNLSCDLVSCCSNLHSIFLIPLELALDSSMILSSLLSPSCNTFLLLPLDVSLLYFSYTYYIHFSTFISKLPQNSLCDF